MFPHPVTGWKTSDSRIFQSPDWRDQKNPDTRFSSRIPFQGVIEITAPT
jgi:hypothetical protein